MRERPIIFNGSMIRAIIDGRKTQTRRPLKPQPLGADNKRAYADLYNLGPEWAIWLPDNRMSEPRVWTCPYGEAGDMLWVRETWAEHPDGEGPIYRATDPGWDEEHTGIKWRPSIHMPRPVSRISLRITEVKAERLQDIRWHEIRAEGIKCLEHDSPGGFCCSPCRSLASEFTGLWDGIYSGRGLVWATNPWVWAILFKRVEP